MKKELIRLLSEKSFKQSKTASFKLTSGGFSNFYVNCKPVTLSHRGQYLIGNIVFDAIKDENVVAIGGLTFGADAIANATSFMSEFKCFPVNSFSVRKERKNHGSSQWIEGDLFLGDRVVIVDDVATTGMSTIKAIERVMTEGMEVVKVVILVDRQEGGVENIKQYCPNVESIVTIADLIREQSQLNI